MSDRQGTYAALGCAQETVGFGGTLRHQPIDNDFSDANVSETHLVNQSAIKRRIHSLMMLPTALAAVASLWFSNPSPHSATAPQPLIPRASELFRSDGDLDDWHQHRVQLRKESCNDAIGGRTSRRQYLRWFSAVSFRVSKPMENFSERVIYVK
jgi:hypothetical protein